MLIGKCKKEFEKWLYQWLINNTELHKEPERIQGHIDEFHLNPFSMQWGVYLEFFDLKGICIELYFAGALNPFYFKVFNPEKRQYSSANYSGFLKMEEAQKAAIEKANEIFNQAA